MNSAVRNTSIQRSYDLTARRSARGVSRSSLLFAAALVVGAVVIFSVTRVKAAADDEKAVAELDTRY